MLENWGLEVFGVGSRNYIERLFKAIYKGTAGNTGWIY
jgi:hypothetical protein